MFSLLTRNNRRAIGFLEHFLGSQAAWILVATGGTGRVPIETFMPSAHGKADAWMTKARKQKRNVLALMAEPVAPVNGRVLVRGDLRGTRHFGVKLPASARANLDAFKPAPFLLMTVGKTIYAGWRLVAPVAQIEAVEDVAKAVAARLGGVSLGHLMPVGGTALQTGEVIELQHLLKDKLCLLTDFRLAGATGKAVGGLSASSLADIEAKPLSWLWPGVIAAGKLALLGGLPDLGKTQVTLSIAAIVSNGGTWPASEAKAETGGVLILASEDGAGDTIKPRLQAAGADLRRVAVTDAALDLREGIAPLVAEAERLGGVRLVIFDPLDRYIEGPAASVRAALTPLMAWAEATGTALLAIVHPAKSAKEMFSGSAAFSRMARAAWFVLPDPQDSGRRLMLFAKGNIIKDRRGHAYRFESVTLPSGIDTSRVSAAVSYSYPLKSVAVYGSLWTSVDGGWHKFLIF